MIIPKLMRENLQEQIGSKIDRIVFKGNVKDHGEIDSESTHRGTGVMSDTQASLPSSMANRATLFSRTAMMSSLPRKSRLSPSQVKASGLCCLWTTWSRSKRYAGHRIHRARC